MSTAHIVALPGFVSVLRIVQLVLTILIIGLIGNTITGWNKLNGGYGGYLNGTDYGPEPLAFMIFCCVWTILINSYFLVTPIFLPVAYNMWAHLSLEVVAWVFWLSGWAAVASWASNWSLLNKATGKIYSYWATAAAGAGMGAIMWVMYTVTLVTFSIRLHKHRTDPNNAHLNSFGLAEKGESHQMGAVQQPQQPVQPQQAMYPPQSAPTPVTYVATPPPQQWQQSPPPQQGQY